jgi:hypothetical protein
VVSIFILNSVVSWDIGLFAWLIIRLFQLIFSAKTVFFFHNKSANSIFSRLISPAERGHCFLQVTSTSESELAEPVGAALLSCRSLPSKTCNWLPLRGLYDPATYPILYRLFLVIIRLSSQATET